MGSICRLLAVLVAASATLSCAGRSEAPASPAAGSMQGRSIYTNVCVRCHGIDGRGGEFTFTPPVADLTSTEVQRKMDVQLFRAVHEGKANTAMGAWKYTLSDEEIRAVLAYVRQLGQSGATRSP